MDKSTIKDGTIVYITDDETVILYDKAEMEKIATQVAEDRTAAETAAQTTQAVADSLPDDYVTAVGKIAENTAEIADVKLTDKELQRRVDALYDIGQGITHRFETDTETAYQKAVPTGAKLMSVKNVGGKSIVFNQLCDIGLENFSETVSAAYHEYGICKFTANVGDKICIYSGGINGTYAANGAYVAGFIGETYIEFWGKQIVQVTGNGNCIVYLRLRGNGNTYDNVSARPEIFNLTKMFGAGNEPSTVEEFEKMFPNDYYSYNAGDIISAGTESVVEQGKNLWDEVWEIGSINSSAGLDTPDSTAIRSKNYTPIIPNSTYIYIFAHTDNTKFNSIKARFYDHNKNYIGYGDKSGASVSKNKAFIAPLNAFYVRFTLPPEYGNVYKNDIALIAGSSGDYTPYHQTAYPIPEAVKSLPGYGWSAGTAKNWVDYENKKYHQCVGAVDLGTVTWNIDQGIRWYTYVLPKYLTDKNAMCNKLIYSSNRELNDESKWINSGAGFFEICVADVTTSADVAAKMSGVILYYELATPIITDISTLIDDDFLRNIEVEAGGSITFKNGNGDDYRIPVPSEEEYVVKLSEIGGSV